MTVGQSPVVGFACNWEPQRADTWSHIPWNLLQALEEAAPGRIADLGLELPRPVRFGARAIATRRRAGRWVSPWKHSRATDRAIEIQLGRALRRRPCDVVVQVHDLAMTDTPFLIFQDLSYQVLLDLWEGGSTLQIEGLDRDLILRRRDRQQNLYARSAGVLAMSGWFARQLVDRSGLPPERVHIAYPGISVAPGSVAQPRRADDRRRLLFIGRDFERKGGPQVVAAARQLRRNGDRQVELTIVGPASLPRGVSADEAGIHFLGPQGHDDVAQLLQDNDLFVMPSHFEAFGIAFAEALSKGVPCIARDAFAMPEMVRPGENGALVATDDASDLAEAILATLDDDHIHETAHAEATIAAARFSWDACAQAVLTAATSSLQSADGAA